MAPYSPSRSSVPVANEVMNGKMLFFIDSITLHKMNNPIVKLDLDSIINC